MTKEQIPSGIAMPCPFANPIDGGQAVVTDVSSVSAENTVNFQKGFGSAYGAPGSSGGKYVSRGEMNGFGKAMSTDVFRYKCGVLNEFDEALVALTGGYHRDAVIDFRERNSWKLFKIISLVDNNTHDPRTEGVTGQYWQYLNVEGVNPSDGRFKLFTFPDVKSGTGIRDLAGYLKITSSTLIGFVKAPHSGVITFTGSLEASYTSDWPGYQDKSYGFAIVAFEGDTISELEELDPVSNFGTCIYFGGDCAGIYGDHFVIDTTYKKVYALNLQADKYYSFWIVSANTTLLSSNMSGVLNVIG